MVTLNRNKSTAYNSSCLCLLWSLVELPFRINILQNRKLKGYEPPQLTTSSEMLYFLTTKTPRKNNFSWRIYFVQTRNYFKICAA